MEAAASTATGGHELLFSVKEEPLDFDMMVKVEGDLDLDLSPERKQSSPMTSTSTSMSASSSSSASVSKGGANSSGINTAANNATAAIPQIGSSNSAFQPYKHQSLTILTNLQRGNVKTTNKENGSESLTFHEKAAKGSLTDTDITESTVNAKDSCGFTPLMWAASHGKLSIVQKLVEKGAQLGGFGPEGETALMFAACNGHTEVLTYLLSMGAESDVEDDAGNTALMFASFGNHVDCVVQLLKCGANMSKPNGIGDTPFEIAINKGHIAAQYAMEDHLKEEIESRFSTMEETKLSSNINNSNSSSSSSTSCSSIVFTNGGSSSSSNCTSTIILSKLCNGISNNATGESGSLLGSMGGGDPLVLKSENGSSNFNPISNSHPHPHP